MQELKPCPFQIEAEIKETSAYYGGHVHEIRVAYTDHESQVFITVAGMSDTPEKAKQKAYEIWNTRHYPPEVMQAVERMKAKKAIWSEVDACFLCPRCGECVATVGWRKDVCKCGHALDWEE